MHLKVKCIPFLYCSFLPWHTSLIAQPEQPPHEHECLPFFLFLKWKKITRANSTAIIAATIIVGQSIFILLLLIFYFSFFVLALSKKHKHHKHKNNECRYRADSKVRCYKERTELIYDK